MWHKVEGEVGKVWSSRNILQLAHYIHDPFIYYNLLINHNNPSISIQPNIYHNTAYLQESE